MMATQMDSGGNHDDGHGPASHTAEYFGLTPTGMNTSAVNAAALAAARDKAEGGASGQHHNVEGLLEEEMAPDHHTWPQSSGMAHAQHSLQEQMQANAASALLQQSSVGHHDDADEQHFSFFDAFHVLDSGIDSMDMLDSHPKPMKKRRGSLAGAVMGNPMNNLMRFQQQQQQQHSTFFPSFNPSSAIPRQLARGSTSSTTSAKESNSRKRRKVKQEQTLGGLGPISATRRLSINDWIPHATFGVDPTPSTLTKSKKSKTQKKSQSVSSFSQGVASTSAGTGTQKKKGLRSRESSSRFRGVSKCKKDGRFQARIRVGQKVVYLGRFKLETEAAMKYDEAAAKFHGKRAILNFPENASHHGSGSMDTNADSSERKASMMLRPPNGGLQGAAAAAQQAEADAAHAKALAQVQAHAQALAESHARSVQKQYLQQHSQQEQMHLQMQGRISQAALVGRSEIQDSSKKPELSVTTTNVGVQNGSKDSQPSPAEHTQAVLPSATSATPNANSNNGMDKNPKNAPQDDENPPPEKNQN